MPHPRIDWQRFSNGMLCALLSAACLISGSSHCLATDLEDAQKFFREGKYDACIEVAKAQVERGVWNEVWPRTLIECYLAIGNYTSALEVYEKAIERYSDSLRLRLLGTRVFQMNNLPSKANEQLEFIDALLSRQPWRLNSRADLVPLGQFFLQRGEDPKQVLKICFDTAAKADPKAIEPHLATAKMALSKNDAKVAATALGKAVKLIDTDPEIYFLLSQAWSSTDPEKSATYLAKSLELNSHFIPSLIDQAEARMSAEAYTDALALLAEVERVNPRLPVMWALRATIAHLEGRYENEGEYRREALKPWSLNPEVDYTIGKHLSKHYRFTEAVEYERRALKMDGSYVPAQTQLAQDLLRLGETSDGWSLVDKVRTQDPYDVTIYNLKQLQSELQKFATLEAPGFVIRMDAREARIYGDEVVAILSEARRVLTDKYKVTLVEPIYVEIFPKQKDFAIRTFGMPGGQGFLGVCFGRLITANSPSALNVDSNWQAVLWHEYCHVITLQKSKNKMPRWLSEGISVYEERERNPTWGQSMDTTYASMILGDDFTPMSQLSGAFLRPKSAMHLQFAYYESSLAVEYWIEAYGMEALLRLLDDLAIGMPASEALRRAPGSLELLDKEFTEYARGRAKSFAGTANLDRPTEVDRENLKQWIIDHSDSLYAQRLKCAALIEAKKWELALACAEALREAMPNDSSNDGVYAMLATIYRAEKDTEREREAWVELVNRSADCKQALLRLIDIDRERGNWKSVTEWTNRLVAIDPMRSDVQSTRALAAEQTDAPETSARALQACLEMDPIDSSSLYYRLAQSQVRLGQTDQAKRSVLKALEESPRYIEALNLLLELTQPAERANASEPATSTETQDTSEASETPKTSADSEVPK